MKENKDTQFGDQERPAKFDVDELVAERGEAYGDPLYDLSRSYRMAQVLESCSVWPKTVRDQALAEARRRVILKLARLAYSPHHEDSWRDIMGYAKCALMILENADD